ncbi:hypothetical protein CK203_069569 [Vitis vinifera]|uniref:Uncharacterized protein n=1 Tax=Vitis vinifera TaxID=29760 RepID=A0A438EKM1_VITVI|nr:hypothetical protein CK203_069569 [Vitis vinifera]
MRKEQRRAESEDGGLTNNFMDVRRRPVGSVKAKPNGKPLVEVDVDVHDPIKASDALPLPLYLANAVFFGFSSPSSISS